VLLERKSSDADPRELNLDLKSGEENLSSESIECWFAERNGNSLLNINILEGQWNGKENSINVKARLKFTVSKSIDLRKDFSESDLTDAKEYGRDVLKEQRNSIDYIELQRKSMEKLLFVWQYYIGSGNQHKRKLINTRRSSITSIKGIINEW